jgi:hypothetical protein
MQADTPRRSESERITRATDSADTNTRFRERRSGALILSKLIPIEASNHYGPLNNVWHANCCVPTTTYPHLFRCETVCVSAISM